jgi:hypothetical protein
MAREALGQRRTAETGGESKSIMVRNPSFGRKSLAARQIELEGVGAEGDMVADTSLNVVGATTGESKWSDCNEVTLDGIASRNNQEFFQHQRKGKECADAEAAQEKPDMQYDNPMMQQQQQRQHRLAAAVESYDVFDTGAERIVTPDGGKDTQYGNPMMQQQQQRQHRLAAAVDSYDVFDTGAERTVTPDGGKDTQYGNPMLQQQQQPARQEVEEAETAEEEERGWGVNVGTVARSTSIVLE